MSKSKLDVPVGTVVTYRKKLLEVAFGYTCKGCYFDTYSKCAKRPCASYQRLDCTPVIFKLVTDEQA